MIIKIHDEIYETNLQKGMAVKTIHTMFSYHKGILTDVIVGNKGLIWALKDNFDHKIYWIPEEFLQELT